MPRQKTFREAFAELVAKQYLPFSIIGENVFCTTKFGCVYIVYFQYIRCIADFLPIPVTDRPTDHILASRHRTIPFPVRALCRPVRIAGKCSRPTDFEA
jgi:hypothetical protein